MSSPKPDEQTCIICLDPLRSITTEQMTLECNHSFHKDCINTWMKKEPSCPLCRTTVGTPSLTEQQTVVNQLLIHRYLGRLQTVQFITAVDMVCSTVNLICGLSLLEWCFTLVGYFGVSILSICALSYYLVFRIISSFYLGYNLIGYIIKDKLDFSSLTNNDLVFFIECFLLVFYSYIVYIVFFVIKDINKFRTELTRIVL